MADINPTLRNYIASGTGTVQYLALYFATSSGGEAVQADEESGTLRAQISSNEIKIKH